MKVMLLLEFLYVCDAHMRESVSNSGFDSFVEIKIQVSALLPLFCLLLVSMRVDS